MKYFYLSVVLLLMSLHSASQSCLPENTSFGSQAAIDNFYATHPDCTTIEGNLSITGNDITNLNGLQNITTFEQALYIEDCPLLENFGGLENLAFIGGSFELILLPLIENFSELSNLTHVGGALNILSLPSLISFNGLNNITSPLTHLTIWATQNLTNLEGLNNIPSVSISLWLRDNTGLQDISALENTDLSELLSLKIIDNTQLSYCHVHSICEALENGSQANVIENNDTGCNNIEEIVNLCIESVPNTPYTDNISFYPNPAKTEIVFTNHQPKTVSIYTQTGQLVNSQENIIHSMNIPILKPGLYFINICYLEGNSMEKLFIN